MSKELKEKYIEIATENERDPENWAKYLNKTVLDVIEIRGLLIEVEKPGLETSFCFGYGLNGLSASGEIEEAAAECEEIEKNFKAFLKANTRDYDKEIAFLKEKGNFCTLCPNSYYKNKIANVEYWNYYGRYLDAQARNPEIITLTELEKSELIMAINRQKADIEKRCRTYWKRYGGSKLRTWTYLQD